MMDTRKTELHCWGVRGSAPVSGPGHSRYGGDTSCYELRHGGDRLILDAGSGLLRLGQAMAQEPPGSVDIVLTHLHLDHIAGLPYFAPLYDDRWRVRLWTGVMPDARAFRDALARVFAPPSFPVVIAELPAVSFHTLQEPVTRVGAWRVAPFALSHPGGAQGFRVMAPCGGIAVLAADHECGDAARDTAIRRAASGAGVLICDATFTPEDAAEQRGRGHSTWEDALTLGVEARRILMSHHSPLRDDDALDAIEARIRARSLRAVMARQDMVITL